MRHGADAARVHAVRPWSTILPRAWLPVIETATTRPRRAQRPAGADALGYHAWAATATWVGRARGRRRARLSRVTPRRPLAYAYDRWRPTFFTEYSDETTPLLIPDGATAAAAGGRARAQRDAGLVVPFRRVRWSQSVLALLATGARCRIGPIRQGRVRPRRVARRLGAEYRQAVRRTRSAPRAASTAGAAVELARRGLGGDGDCAAVPRRHARVPPVRAAPRRARIARLRRGDARRPSRPPDLAPRRPRCGSGACISFDDDASSLLRGFPADAFFGTNVLLGNAEYRASARLHQRGVGTWPLFLRAIHVSGFVDAGQAWTAAFRGRGTRSCRGAPKPART